MHRIKHYSLLLLTVFLLALCSCNESKKKSYTPSPINPEVERIDNIPDSALYVKLTAVTADSITVRVSETRETKQYAYRYAKQCGQIKGSLTVGDDLTIFPEEQSHSIQIAINVSELDGRWFYDMAQHRGLKFETRGGLSSINTQQISFRQWKLLNAKLYIYYVDMQQVADDRHQFLVHEAEIKRLSKDKLVFVFLGKTYSCQRLNGVIKLKTV